MALSEIATGLYLLRFAVDTERKTLIVKTV
jgi:hypothetical protein